MAYFRRGRGAAAQRACTALFPSSSVVIAYQLLFGAHTGIVPDGIADLGVEDLEWAGDAAMLVNYLKGPTAEERVTLSRRAVRLAEPWLEYSALSRRFAAPAEGSELWPRHEDRPARREAHQLRKPAERVAGFALLFHRCRTHQTVFRMRREGVLWQGSGCLTGSFWRWSPP
jgi:hypothetical protein